MKFLRLTTLFILTFFCINLTYTAAYDDDASEVDFYVPGILANDAMEQVNFLLCFMESINFATFVDKGVYKALTDEAKCESASGADATSDAASATGASADGGGSGGVADTVEATNYTPGIYQGVTSGSSVTGKGWVDIEMEMEDQLGSEVMIPFTAFLSTTVTADKSADNKFGTFTMRYDLRNKNANAGVGLPLANLPVNQGYLNVDNTTIQYRETGMRSPDISIVADLADANNIQGFLQTVVTVEEEGVPPVTYLVGHQIQVNEGANRYCQKFSSAVPYARNAQGVWEADPGGDVGSSAFQTAVDTAVDGTGRVSTMGGTPKTMYGEHCWNTSKAAAKRVVYEYGTYKASDDSRADLENPSMSLESVGLTPPVWAHASYWGVHVNYADRGRITESTVFKNQRDKDDSANYNLNKNFLEITKRTKQDLALNQLGGVSIQLHVQGFKIESETWRTKLGNLGFPTNDALLCNASDGECPEYSGNISVNASGTEVTFTLTHGMDWNNRVMPFELTTPIVFTSTQWATQMTDSGWNRRMQFWDPDSHQSYTAPYSAFTNVDATSTETADRVTTRIESKISLTELEADIALEAGDGATGLLCIRECLDSDAMNNTMATLFAGSRTVPPTNPLDNSMRVSPYKDIGPYFKVNMYPDNDNSGDKSGISGQEDRLPAGAHNWIGGTVVGDAATYTVTDSGGGVKKLRDVLAGVGKYLDYSNANKTLLDGRKHGDNLRNYRYWSKPTSYTYDNYSRNMGWAFNMTTVIDSDTNKGALLCEPDGSGNVRGYYDRIKTEASSGGVAVFGHAAGTNAYYCDYRMWDGSVGTIYEIRIKQMPDYVLSSAGSVVSVTAPKKLELTVPDSGVTYNFAPANTQPLAGKKYKLKFEGFGELHNLPGRVIDMDLYPNGDFDKGRYVDEWKASYRYIHEFIIPDGTVLINSSGENIKVRALKGDEYLLKLGSIPAGVAYTKTSTDLPETSNIQNLAEGANSIGNVLSTTLPSAGSDDPSVIHGKTIYPPPAN